MVIKTIYNTAILSVCLLALTGCETLTKFERWVNNADNIGVTEEMLKERESKKPGYIISFNKIIKERTTKEIEVLVPSYVYENKTICINRNSYLSSKNIKKIERIPNKKINNTYDIILYLDNSGMIKYDIISTTFKGQKIGVLVNKKFYRSSMVQQPLDKEQKKIMIKGPFGDAVSKKIVEKSTINYKFYNDKDFATIFKIDDIINPK